MAFKRLLTMDELAEVLKCTRTSIYNFRRQGRIKVRKIGQRYFITEAEVNNIIRDGLPPPTKEWLEMVKLDKRARRAAAKSKEQ